MEQNIDRYRKIDVENTPVLAVLLETIERENLMISINIFPLSKNYAILFVLLGYS